MGGFFSALFEIEQRQTALVSFHCGSCCQSSRSIQPTTAMARLHEIERSLMRQKHGVIWRNRGFYMAQALAIFANLGL